MFGIHKLGSWNSLGSIRICAMLADITFEFGIYPNIPNLVGYLAASYAKSWRVHKSQVFSKRWNWELKEKWCVIAVSHRDIMTWRLWKVTSMMSRHSFSFDIDIFWTNQFWKYNFQVFKLVHVFSLSLSPPLLLFSHTFSLYLSLPTLSLPLSFVPCLCRPSPLPSLERGQWIFHSKHHFTAALTFVCT